MHCRTTKNSITVVILTYNEELHLDRAIKSVAPLFGRIIIVDSGSTDRTLEIASAHHIEIYTNKFVNQARQFNWALANCEIDSEWVMRLDADETIGKDVCDGICKAIASKSPGISGFRLHRKHIFFGKWIRFGGRYPVSLIRVWRNGFGKVEDRWMDEHVEIWGGSIATIFGDFRDENLKDIHYFIEKHNSYATREAIEVVFERHAIRVSNSIQNRNSGILTLQSKIKRILKNRIYGKIYFGFGPLAYFMYRYFLQLGFLDGWQGFTYHFLQGWWYRFLVEVKTREIEAEILPIADIAVARKKIAEKIGVADL